KEASGLANPPQAPGSAPKPIISPTIDIPPPVSGTGTPLPPLTNQGPTAQSSASPTAAPPAPAAPAAPAAPITKIDFRSEPGEPPLAPKPGLVQAYHVKHDGETPRDIAQRTLGGADRCEDILKLNPRLKTDTSLIEGTLVRLPADACVPGDGVEAVQPLP